MVGGPGLDARLFTDLSTLQHDRLVTPSAEVFVRTAAPPQLPAGPWPIAAKGFAGATPAIDAAALVRDAKPMGAHLIECSGNADPDNFGLMSVAEWDGVPLVSVTAGAACATPSENTNFVVSSIPIRPDTMPRSFRPAATSAYGLSCSCQVRTSKVPVNGPSAICSRARSSSNDGHTANGSPF